MALLMARIFLPVTLFLLPFGLYAQDQHFIYLQTENNQPFYVRMNGKVFSSTSGGYVILSKLTNGNYQLFTGFPKNEYPEQEFQVTIDGNDEGFLLKKLENGWSLFNIETLALTEGVNTKPVQQEKKTATVSNDPFATLLADAVKDSSILENEVVAKPPEVEVDKPDTSKTVASVITEKAPVDSVAIQHVEVKKDTLQETVSAKNETAPATKIIPADTVAVSEKATTPIVSDSAAISSSLPSKENAFKRILLVNEKGGLELVYVDIALKDTIRIFLPVSINNINREEQTAKVIYNPPVKDTAALTITPTVIADNSVQSTKKDNDKRMGNVDSIVTAPKQDSVAIPGSVVAPEKQEQENQKVPEPVESNLQKDTAAVEKKVEDPNRPQVIYSSSVNSDCKDFATNKDFLRLRKKMAAETDNDKMIEVARKYFRSKCFTTDQIRNLSYLFLNDEGKYKFFDAAYPFASDSNEYHTLESQLKDAYYINRFRAMIHK